MALSASSLFHFTSDKASLFGILEQNFKVYACKESIVFGKGVNEIRVPMVSFCDIPLSQIKDHISKYGKYGIGLTKEWGIRNGLNPVLYLSKGSNVSLSYLRALSHFVQGDVNNTPELTGEQKLLLDVVRYIKNYEGRLERKGSTIESYRYSDEREWRYAPPIDDDRLMLSFEEWYKKR